MFFELALYFIFLSLFETCLKCWLCRFILPQWLNKPRFHCSCIRNLAKFILICKHKCFKRLLVLLNLADISFRTQFADISFRTQFALYVIGLPIFVWSETKVLPYEWFGVFLRNQLQFLLHTINGFITLFICFYLNGVFIISRLSTSLSTLVSTDEGEAMRLCNKLCTNNTNIA